MFGASIMHCQFSWSLSRPRLVASFTPNHSASVAKFCSLQEGAGNYATHMDDHGRMHTHTHINTESYAHTHTHTSTIIHTAPG